MKLHSFIVAVLGTHIVTFGDAFSSPSTNNFSFTPSALIRGKKFSPLSTRRSTRLNISSSKTDGTSGAASQNVFGIVSDALTELSFSVLHAFDADPIKDSSKNLRVLWVRALLDKKGMIEDDIAEKFLPPTTKGLVTSDAGANLLGPAVKFAEWIQARTEFIDKGVNYFLENPLCTSVTEGKKPCNIVLFGAGYDTRALRFRNEHEGKINFYEVDLPEVVKGKRILYDKFRSEHDPNFENESTLIPLDLNQCGSDSDSEPVSLIDVLKDNGLDPDKPTFFVFEAVLFYVNESAVRNIMNELFSYSQASKSESMLCLTDSLKPFVDVPFSNEARVFFEENDMNLMEHRSRWGGAVHFCLAASKKVSGVEGTSDVIAQYVDDKVGGIVNSYMPTQSNNPSILSDPSFDNVWYAVGYPWQIDGYDTPFEASLVKDKNKKSGKPFATRLWGEPIVIYRDINGELVAMADVCPHRSVPLSMGTINENRELVCFYHGWSFGEKGECSNVPTLNIADEDGNLIDRNRDSKNFLRSVTKANCGNNRAVVEHEGMVYVWRGNVLEADPLLLPSRRKGDMESVPINTVLDYDVDYSYIVENNLDSPHLFFLHDGSIPPIESLGMTNSNLHKLKLNLFVDDCGIGHMGRLEGTRPKKLIRFDPPNIVRHGGVSGFEEEFHIVPIARGRTRVLLRQHLPKGPILSTLTSIPGVLPMLTLLVNNWNYHIALEDSCVMQGQAHRIEDWGSPRMTVGGLGDDLIKRFWTWRSKAHKALLENGDKKNSSPYFVDFLRHDAKASRGSIPTGTSFGDAPELVSQLREELHLRDNFLVSSETVVDEETGNDVGVWGIKQTYVQQTPAANFPPMNYKQYKRLLAFDDVVKKLANLNQPTTPPLPKIDNQGYINKQDDDDGVDFQADDMPSGQELRPKRGAALVMTAKKKK